MLSMQGIDFGYPPPEGSPAGTPPTVIVKNIGKSVLAGQRIGILGANGQGKSTVVKTIARDLAPLAGEIIEGKGLSIGYFAQQELDVLRPQDTPLEHMIWLVKDTTARGALSGQATREQDLRSFLGSFNFTGDQVKQAVGTMSGGEKARLVLCMLVWQRPNLLLLDEPTNHLDLATREALAVALNEFEGTLMLVSHDRALLRSVCDEFWLVGRGRVSDFDGDLDDYQRYLLDEAKRLREEARLASREVESAAATVTVPPPQPAAQERQQRSNQAKPLKRELAQIDEQLAAAGAEKTSLEARLSTPLPAAEIAETGRRLKALNEEIDRLEERWLAVSDQIETLAAT
jgi:ATP-binding cassette subfamily F protein 3